VRLLVNHPAGALPRCGRLGLCLAAAALLAFGFACGPRNPVLGAWEIDADDNSRGTLLAVEAAEMTTLRFESASIAAPGAEIAVSYVTEGDVVRVVRGDGRGEHRVEVLPDGRIRVELPIGVTAVYRRGGSRG
jgi:hypothetical protein